MNQHHLSSYFPNNVLLVFSKQIFLLNFLVNTVFFLPQNIFLIFFANRSLWIGLMSLPDLVWNSLSVFSHEPGEPDSGFTRIYGGSFLGLVLPGAGDPASGTACRWRRFHLKRAPCSVSMRYDLCVVLSPVTTAGVVHVFWLSSHVRTWSPRCNGASCLAPCCLL